MQLGLGDLGALVVTGAVFGELPAWGLGDLGVVSGEWPWVWEMLGIGTGLGNWNCFLVHGLGFGRPGRGWFLVNGLECGLVPRQSPARPDDWGFN